MDETNFNIQDIPSMFPIIYKKPIFIECGNGWYDLIFDLSNNISKIIQKRHPQAEEVYDTQVTQVKEKYGGLRFYVNLCTDEIYKMIEEFENSSKVICEKCGNYGSTIEKRNGWFYNRCHKCWDEMNDKA